ncbi:hypothetical protein [Niveispirillum sp.]|uniref:hypothetical protein n=1 Tax=Niveispirillum sp. TaxID=1917217 RepID=UPI001B587324|nr:hypothetical protein [Niveispirillum sp.]MBP7336266.1 hypothetical protein [Niveispirillum sp.]
MKTIRTAMVDKHELRIVLKNDIHVGLIFGPDKTRLAMIEGLSADEVWQILLNKLAQSSPRYFGFDGAITHFQKFFPNGFKDAAFLDKERNYKEGALKLLGDALPLAQALESQDMGEKVLRVFQRTNLLSPFEKTRLQELLRGKSADAFIRAAAGFAQGDRSMLGVLERILKPHDCAKWTIVTYLPFLWCPKAHMFLKPEVTKDFAERVGHRFAHDYSPRLETGVYDSLLDLARQTDAALAPLAPQDWIDIQSFIWVVGDYQAPADLPRPV